MSRLKPQVSEQHRIMKISNKEIIKAIGEEAYQKALKMIEEEKQCPYDDDYKVKEMFENKKCFRCFVRGCDINT